MHNFHIASMTVSEFRAFRKALVVLVRAGIPMDVAVDILVSSKVKRYEA